MINKSDDRATHSLNAVLPMYEGMKNITTDIEKYTRLVGAYAIHQRVQPINP